MQRVYFGFDVEELKNIQLDDEFVVIGEEVEFKNEKVIRRFNLKKIDKINNLIIKIDGKELR